MNESSSNVRRTRKKWRRFELMNLINAYKSKECLWNQELQSYRRPDLRLQAVNELCDQFGVTPDEIKAKLKTLRATYLLELRKLETNLAEGREPRLYYFNQMKFLYKIMKSKISGSDDYEDHDAIAAYIKAEENSGASCEENEPCEELEEMEEIEDILEDDSTQACHERLTEYTDYNFPEFCKLVDSILKELPEKMAIDAMQDLKTIIFRYKKAAIHLKRLPKTVVKNNSFLNMDDESNEAPVNDSPLYEDEIPFKSDSVVEESAENISAVTDQESPIKHSSIIEDDGSTAKISPNVEKDNTKKILNVHQRKRRSGEKNVSGTGSEKKKRKVWVRPFLMKRLEYDDESALVTDLLSNSGDINNSIGIEYDQFEELHSQICSLIKGQDTEMRQAIGTKSKLAITLRYLFTGESYKSLGDRARIGNSTIGTFTTTVWNAIYNTLKPRYMQIPTTDDKWKEISNDFGNIWHFPHCLGVLDAKHIQVVYKQKRSDPSYRKNSNKKTIRSVVLLALVDAYGHFRYIDVDCSLTPPDHNLFANTELYDGMQKNEYNIPRPSVLSQQIAKTPYFIIADNNVPSLGINMIHPFSDSIPLTQKQEVFNYRFGRAKTVADDAFGKLASRFKIFQRRLDIPISRVEKMIKCACMLHNYISGNVKYRSGEIVELIPEELPDTVWDLSCNFLETNHNDFADNVREQLAKYFVTAGNVAFQWGKVRPTFFKSSE